VTPAIRLDGRNAGNVDRLNPGGFWAIVGTIPRSKARSYRQVNLLEKRHRLGVDLGLDLLERYSLYGIEMRHRTLAKAW
jgi:hypothetical protein